MMAPDISTGALVLVALTAARVLVPLIAILALGSAARRIQTALP